jgi:hypothetical protein
MQGALVHRKVSPPQGLQILPQHGTGRQDQTGGTPRPLPGLPDSWPRPGRPVLPLRGGAGGRVSEVSLPGTTPLPLAHGEAQNKEEPKEESPDATTQYARGSNTNRGSRVRGAAGRPVGHHQGGRAVLGILGHRVPGDARHSEDGPRHRPDGHPQLTSEAGRHRGRSPSEGGDSLQGAAGRHRRESDHRDCLQSGQHHVSISRRGHHADERNILGGTRRWLGFNIRGSESAHGPGQPQPVSD